MKKGFTIIELMMVVAVIGLLAAIALPNFLAYRDKAFCSSVEMDAGNIASALTCYFSDPDNKSCGSLDSLLNSDCDFQLQEKGSALLRQVPTGGRYYWEILVTDHSGRCPRGKYFTKYMGTSKMAGWHQ